MILKFLLVVLTLYLHLNLSADKDIKDYLLNNIISLDNSDCLDRLIEEATDKKLILLGEASHGTSEFYTWRTEISKKLISQGASFIVVEGDWLPCYYINLYIKGRLEDNISAEQLLKDSFQRWPQWMWSNRETLDLIKWLYEYNKELDYLDKVGFYGMDVYGQWDSLRELREIAETLESDKFTNALAVYDLFDKYDYNEWDYAVAVARGDASLQPRLKQSADTIARKVDLLIKDDDLFSLHIKQNALVMKNSEKYYRNAVVDNVTAWNKRVDHMYQTVLNILDFYGEKSTGIVWAHNTHIGDARATPMSQSNQYNIGQLSRQQFGDTNVYNIGFATYKGKVLAGYQWGDSMQTMKIPDAVEGSIEDIFFKIRKEPFYVLFNHEARSIDAFRRPIGNRAIGVTYDPRQDNQRNFVPSLIPYRYNALIFIPISTPLESL